MATFDTHSTPNPNSLKITISEGQFIQEGMLAFNSQDEAANHPLGRALMGIDGVTDVLITPAFLTVSKQDAVEWNDVLPAVEDALQEHLDAQAT